MLEGKKNPPIAFLRVSTRLISVQNETIPAQIKQLRQARNTYARLLSTI